MGSAADRCGSPLSWLWRHGATKKELHNAYERGYADGESDGRNHAEALAEEEWDTGYEAGFSDGEEESAAEAEELEDLEGEIEAEERCERYGYP